MKKKRFILSAVVALALGCGNCSADAYTTLQEAIIDDTLPNVERTYTLTGDEAYTTALGNMGGDNSTLTVDGAGYGISSDGSVGINAVNAGQTLNLKNIGSATKNADGTYTVNKSLNNFADTTVLVDGGTLNVDKSVFSGVQNGVIQANANSNLNISNTIFSGVTSTYTGGYGPALVKNAGTMSIDKSAFVGNDVTENVTTYVAGIVENAGHITQITNSDFNYNHITCTSTVVDIFGGLIQNSNGATIDLIQNNNFVGNRIYTEFRSPHGGIIHNSGNIKLIDNTIFENNEMTSAPNQFGGAHGVAIDNNGGSRIDKITNSIFRNNKTYRTGTATTSSNYHASGGAISNYSYIGEISNTLFEGNSAESVASNANGGAIMNLYINDNSKIEKIENVQFINNHAYSQNNSASGGAIISDAEIGDISGLFQGNYVQSGSGYAYGGAISNDGTIGIINGNFKENYAKASCDKAGYMGGYGGAIYNYGGKISKIIGNFENNYAQNVSGVSSAVGGAIYNRGNAEITNGIEGNFIGNYTYSAGGSAYGGAIYNNSYSTIGDIIGDFINNYAYATGTYARGGAIFNNSNSSIGAITGNFTNNYAYSSGTDAGGGAINNNSNNSSIGVITGDFINNYAYSTGTYANGGALANVNKIKGVFGNFIGNYAKATGTNAIGGAIANRYGNASSYGQIEQISGTFSGNYAQTTGTEYAHGGAIYNQANTVIGEIINSNFYNNYAKATNGAALGGAIYTGSDLNIVADNGTSTFKGNYTDTAGTIEDNAIYVDANNKTLKLEQKNNGKMYMYDSINGQTGYNVNITGDNSGTFYMFNDIKNANVAFNNTTVNTVNNDIHVYDFNSFTVNGNSNFVPDVNLSNQTMDRITANSYGSHGGKLNVSDMNITADTTAEKVEVYFAQPGLKDYVTSSKTEYMSPIFKYTIKYDNRDDAGYFVFGRGSSSDFSNFNPSVLASPVVAQAGVQATLNETINYSFQHADSFTKLPRAERMAQINANKYAVLGHSEDVVRKNPADGNNSWIVSHSLTMTENNTSLSRGKGERNFSSTDFNENLNMANQYKNNAGVWVKPYTSFEKINLSGGPNVETITYGTLVGFDTDFKDLKHGWVGVTSGFVGYNGAHLNYNGVSSTLNGGVLGATETFYKGNFWTALTATAGASVADTSTMYGNENSTNLMAGIASKTGYNFEFKQGKFIIQPSWMMAYSFINTFDYTNAAGVKIDSDPLHTIQLNPNIRFIGNIKGWQPYASVGMVWNLLNETNVTANGVALPHMHIKPYVQYGVGLQKSVGERFTGFGQVMLHNGGRNGVALTFGARWALGKSSQKSKAKTSKTSINTEKKVLKQSTNTYAGEKHVLK